jgi:hypothetical protein
MKPFSDIEAFRHIVAHIDANCEYHCITNKPTIRFTGTVKLHGTNAGIRFKGDEVIAHGRTKVLTIGDDNYGFAMFVERNKEVLKKLAAKYKSILNSDDITLYGEWCGKGIQSGVAISKLDKLLAIFAVYDHKYEEEITFVTANISVVKGMLEESPSEEGEVEGVMRRMSLKGQLTKLHKRLDALNRLSWGNFNSIEISDLEEINNNRIYLITQAKTYEIDIDFNNPDAAAEKITEYTLEVEDRCPFANNSELFPISTAEDLGIGEGIVWVNHEEHLKFKSKGLKHSKRDRVKVEVAPEKVAAIKDLVTALLPQWRLDQGLEVLKTQGLALIPQNTSVYLKWINQDILKEEQDRITANAFDWKELTGEISRTAREFYLIKGCNG